MKRGADIPVEPVALDQDLGARLQVFLMISEIVLKMKVLKSRVKWKDPELIHHSQVKRKILRSP